MNSLLNTIYTITIGPLELLFEAIFYTTNRFVSPGISIMVLSFVLNILLLPLYNRADKIQEEEKKIEEDLGYVVNHIKKSFKGDEQYMMLQTYYRENNYKPIYSLKGLLPLLLEIPFFIAAYNYLSNLSLLDGASFFIISNLKEPDGLLFGINILPILMTIINIISSAIYTKGDSLKSKLQLYGTALVFLVLLYDSPSGLVLYWTLNNLFSLVKNILNKLKNKQTIVFYSILAFGIIGILYSLLSSRFTNRAKLIIVTILAFTCILAVFLRTKKNIDSSFFHKYSNFLFFLNMLFFSLLVGLYIPSQVITASPEEFIDTTSLLNPNSYIHNTLLLSVGVFVLWFGVYYLMSKEKTKSIFCFISTIFVFVSLLDYMFFGTNLGNMSNCLVYDSIPTFSSMEYLLNIGVILIISFIVFLIYKKSNDFIKYVSAILCVSILFVSFLNVKKINNAYTSVVDRVTSNDSSDAMIKLSKNGNNVIVIMLDRAINCYYPYIINEIPDLQEQYDGFVYYPNTLSFGGQTNISTPSLFGGYEYTPDEMDKRDDELIKDKHNEALKVMPAIFSINDYNVSVFDPPYAGYTHIPNLSIYKDDICKNVNAYNTSETMILEQLNRNLFFFGMSKICPTVFFTTIYSRGNYLSTSPTYNMPFVTQYEVLQNLNKMTRFVDTNGEVTILQNSATHEPTILTEPNYELPKEETILTYDGKERIKESIDGKLMTLNTETQVSHYHVNASSLKQIGEWLDYLKKNDVYDNTRIIICSDHGTPLGIYDEMYIDEDDLLKYNPLLLYKDFNNHDSRTEYSLMTLADIPYLATEGIINDLYNPYTGKAIEKQYKDVEFYIRKTDNLTIYENNGTVFVPTQVYSVKENCLDINNWK